MSEEILVHTNSSLTTCAAEPISTYACVVWRELTYHDRREPQSYRDKVFRNTGTRKTVQSKTGYWLSSSATLPRSSALMEWYRGLILKGNSRCSNNFTQCWINWVEMTFSIENILICYCKATVNLSSKTWSHKTTFLKTYLACFLGRKGGISTCKSQQERNYPCDLVEQTFQHLPLPRIRKAKLVRSEEKRVNG